MRFRAYMVSVLLAATLALASQSILLPTFNQSLIDPVPRPLLNSVRECLAAINLFIVDGNFNALWETLDRTGHGLDPWPQVDATRRDLVALAYRATFPALHLTLAGIERSHGHYAVELDGFDTPAFPGWLDVEPSVQPVESPFLIDIDEQGAVQRVGAFLGSGPLVDLAPDVGATFALSSGAHLVAARISLTPSARGTRYLTVDGPALIVAESGELDVTGEGRQFVLESAASQWRRMAANESAALAPGDLLYLPSGYATLTLSGRAPATFVYTGVARQKGSEETVDEDGRAGPPKLADLAAGSTASPATAWFGTIEPLAATPVQDTGSMRRFQASWVVLPPRTHADVSLVSTFVTFATFDRIGDQDARSSEDRLINETDQTIVQMMIRVL